MTRGGRVLVAMSGGVDSTLVAALLASSGCHEPVGVTLRIWSCEAGPGDAGASCCGLDGAAAAREAAGALGIPHYTLDCRAEFSDEVLAPAWRAYAAGMTPNPCVHCNAAVKWPLLLRHAASLGAACIATGHYARVSAGSPGTAPALFRGADPDKDQSYFLFALTPEQLDSTLFPLGGMAKPEVRAEARRLGLPNADRPDSQDACLGGDGVCFAEALRRHLGERARPGAVVHQDGRVLGTHQGVHLFTVGQRKGLRFAAGKRTYVTAIRADRGEVVVSDDTRDLEAGALLATRVTWLCAPPGPEEEVLAQIRYRHQAAPVRLAVGHAGEVLARFAAPQRSITPGQAVVFYRGERVLGGGWIERPVRDPEEART